MPGQKVPEAERRRQLLAATMTVALRDGLEAVTARAVAAEAGASPGLVFFHFGSKDGLMRALLDVLLAGALDAEVTPEIAALPTARARLRKAVQIELDGIPEQRDPVELLLSIWFLRDPEARALIGGALDRYRSVFVELCRGVTPDEAIAQTMATLVVSLIQGASFQAVRDPASFDAGSFGKALDALTDPA